jgi:hypothetical protein
MIHLPDVKEEIAVEENIKFQKVFVKQKTQKSLTLFIQKKIFKYFKTHIKIKFYKN